jgi:hypothetical protein
LYAIFRIIVQRTDPRATKAVSNQGLLTLSVLYVVRANHHPMFLLEARLALDPQSAQYTVRQGLRGESLKGERIRPPTTMGLAAWGHWPFRYSLLWCQSVEIGDFAETPHRKVGKPFELMHI